MPRVPPTTGRRRADAQRASALRVSRCVCLSAAWRGVSGSFHLLKENCIMAKANKPVHEIRLGRIKAAIWENETQNGTRHNVTLQRIYRDEGGQWNTSDSFGRDDLPLIAKVADMAHTWIFQQGQTGTEREARKEAQEASF